MIAGYEYGTPVPSPVSSALPQRHTLERVTRRRLQRRLAPSPSNASSTSMTSEVHTSSPVESRRRLPPLYRPWLRKVAWGRSWLPSDDAPPSEPQSEPALDPDTPSESEINLARSFSLPTKQQQQHSAKLTSDKLKTLPSRLLKAAQKPASKELNRTYSASEIKEYFIRHGSRRHCLSLHDLQGTAGHASTSQEVDAASTAAAQHTGSFARKSSHRSSKGSLRKAKSMSSFAVDAEYKASPYSSLAAHTLLTQPRCRPPRPSLSDVEVDDDESDLDSFFGYNSDEDEDSDTVVGSDIQSLFSEEEEDSDDSGETITDSLIPSMNRGDPSCTSQTNPLFRDSISSVEGLFMKNNRNSYILDNLSLFTNEESVDPVDDASLQFFLVEKEAFASHHVPDSAAPPSQASVRWVQGQPPSDETSLFPLMQNTPPQGTSVSSVRSLRSSDNSHFDAVDNLSLLSNEESVDPERREPWEVTASNNDLMVSVSTPTLGSWRDSSPTTNAPRTMIPSSFPPVHNFSEIPQTASDDSESSDSALTPTPRTSPPYSTMLGNVWEVESRTDSEFSSVHLDDLAFDSGFARSCDNSERGFSPDACDGAPAGTPPGTHVHRNQSMFSLIVDKFSTVKFVPKEKPKIPPRSSSLTKLLNCKPQDNHSHVPPPPVVRRVSHTTTQQQSPGTQPQPQPHQTKESETKNNVEVVSNTKNDQTECNVSSGDTCVFGTNLVDESTHDKPLVISKPNLHESVGFKSNSGVTFTETQDNDSLPSDIVMNIDETNESIKRIQTIENLEEGNTQGHEESIEKDAPHDVDTVDNVNQTLNDNGLGSVRSSICSDILNEAFLELSDFADVQNLPTDASLEEAFLKIVPSDDSKKVFAVEPTSQSGIHQEEPPPVDLETNDSSRQPHMITDEDAEEQDEQLKEYDLCITPDNVLDGEKDNKSSQLSSDSSSVTQDNRESHEMVVCCDTSKTFEESNGESQTPHRYIEGSDVQRNSLGITTTREHLIINATQKNIKDGNQPETPNPSVVTSVTEKSIIAKEQESMTSSENVNKQYATDPFFSLQSLKSEKDSIVKVTSVRDLIKNFEIPQKCNSQTIAPSKPTLNGKSKPQITKAPHCTLPLTPRMDVESQKPDNSDITLTYHKPLPDEREAAKVLRESVSSGVSSESSEEDEVELKSKTFIVQEATDAGDVWSKSLVNTEAPLVQIKLPSGIDINVATQDEDFPSVQPCSSPVNSERSNEGDVMQHSEEEVNVVNVLDENKEVNVVSVEDEEQKDYIVLHSRTNSNSPTTLCGEEEQNEEGEMEEEQNEEGEMEEEQNERKTDDKDEDRGSTLRPCPPERTLFISKNNPAYFSVRKESQGAPEQPFHREMPTKAPRPSKMKSGNDIGDNNNNIIISSGSSSHLNRSRVRVPLVDLNDSTDSESSFIERLLRHQKSLVPSSVTSSLPSMSGSDCNSYQSLPSGWRHCALPGVGCREGICMLPASIMFSTVVA